MRVNTLWEFQFILLVSRRRNVKPATIETILAYVPQRRNTIQTMNIKRQTSTCCIREIKTELKTIINNM